MASWKEPINNAYNSKNNSNPIKDVTEKTLKKPLQQVLPEDTIVSIDPNKNAENSSNSDGRGNDESSPPGDRYLEQPSGSGYKSVQSAALISVDILNETLNKPGTAREYSSSRSTSQDITVYTASINQASELTGKIWVEPSKCSPSVGYSSPEPHGGQTQVALPRESDPNQPQSASSRDSQHDIKSLNAMHLTNKSGFGSDQIRNLPKNTNHSLPSLPLTKFPNPKPSRKTPGFTETVPAEPDSSDIRDNPQQNRASASQESRDSCSFVSGVGGESCNSVTSGGSASASLTSDDPNHRETSANPVSEQITYEREANENLALILPEQRSSGDVVERSELAEQSSRNVSEVSEVPSRRLRWQDAYHEASTGYSGCVDLTLREEDPTDNRDLPLLGHQEGQFRQLRVGRMRFYRHDGTPSFFILPQHRFRETCVTKGHGKETNQEMQTTFVREIAWIENLCKIKKS